MTNEQLEQWRQVWSTVALLAQDHEDPRLNLAVSLLHDTIKRAFTERTADLVADNAKLREVARAMLSDHMTSEQHHPGYVLVPTVPFEAMRAIMEQGQ